MSQLQLSERIAEALLEIEAVVLKPNDPFTWSSGLKSPIYCDNRMTISYPDVREMITDGFVELIREYFPDAEVIAGAATGGIPHAAWVADKMNLPMIYVRDKAKGHGRQNKIEGLLKLGQKTVVVEDLISTGGSSLKVAEAVNEEGGIALGVAAIFTYQLDKATASFQEAGIPLQTLSNYEALLQVAVRTGQIREDQLAMLQQWRKNPQSFGA